MDQKTDHPENPSTLLLFHVASLVSQQRLLPTYSVYSARISHRQSSLRVSLYYTRSSRLLEKAVVEGWKSPFGSTVYAGVVAVNVAKTDQACG